MIEECRAMIKRKARLAALATLIPIPGIDVFTDVVLLKQSIAYIDDKFGNRMDDGQKDYIHMYVLGSSLTSSLIKRVGLRLAMKSALRFVPVLGQLIAILVSYFLFLKIAGAYLAERQSQNLQNK